MKALRPLAVALTVVPCCSVIGSETGLIIASPNPELSFSVGPKFVSKLIVDGEQIAGASLGMTLAANYGAFKEAIVGYTDLSSSSNVAVAYRTSYLFALNKTVGIEPKFSVLTHPIEDSANPLYLIAKNTGGELYHTQYEAGIGFPFTALGIKIRPSYTYNTTHQGSDYSLTTLYSIPLLSLGTEIDISTEAGALRGYTITGPTLSLTQLGHTITPLVLRTNYTVLGVSIPYQISRFINLKVGWSYEESYSHLNQAVATPGAGSFSKQKRLQTGVFSSQVNFIF